MAGQSRTNPYASLALSDSGQITPTTTATTGPNKPCKLAKFKAGSNNTGRISIGKIGLTGGQNAAGGHMLSAREDSGWVPIANTNLVGIVAENGTDIVSWWVLT